MVKFFFHLDKLIKDGNGLIDSAVKECYTVWKRGDNYSKQLSWLTAVFYLFEWQVTDTIRFQIILS